MTKNEAISISVCMASYNGAEYITEQLASILAQLPSDAEIVIVDDASSDDTAAVIESIEDRRIRLIRHSSNRGYVATFEEAIAEARGEILMLSDQDDVWPADHVRSLVDGLRGSDVVASNVALYPDAFPLPTPLGGRSWRLPDQRRQRPLRNMLGVLAGSIPYFGCAMGFRRQALSVILPFPSFLVESHDLWIALCGNACRSMSHVPGVTVLRRLHDSNASTSRPRKLRTVVRARWMLLRGAWEARRRVRRRAAQGR